MFCMCYASCFIKLTSLQLSGNNSQSVTWGQGGFVRCSESAFLKWSSEKLNYGDPNRGFYFGGIKIATFVFLIFCLIILPAYWIDTAKTKLPEIHNESIWCWESVLCVIALLSAVLGRRCPGHMDGNNIKNIWHISDLFLIYLRKKSAIVKSALADVLALNNL